jgi:hypothetical protein
MSEFIVFSSSNEENKSLTYEIFSQIILDIKFQTIIDHLSVCLLDLLTIFLFTRICQFLNETHVRKGFILLIDFLLFFFLFNFFPTV